MRVFEAGKITGRKKTIFPRNAFFFYMHACLYATRIEIRRYVSELRNSHIKYAATSTYHVSSSVTCGLPYESRPVMYHEEIRQIKPKTCG